MERRAPGGGLRRKGGRHACVVLQHRLRYRVVISGCGGADPAGFLGAPRQSRRQGRRHRCRWRRGRGRVTALSPSALSIDGYAFTPAQAVKIERPGDSIWNGAAIGYGVGALFGLTIGAEACLHGSTWRCVNAGGITYGLLGAVIDYAHKGRRTIYKSQAAAPRRAVRIVPDITPERKGVAVALAF